MTQTMPTTRIRISAAHRAGYLHSLAVTGSHSAACQSIGVSRRTMAAHIAAHADFAREVDDASAQFADSLLVEAHRRAVTGVERPILFQGKVVATERRHSDKLLAIMLEKIGPEAFRAPDRIVHEHTGVVRHEVGSQPISRAFLESLPKPAQIDVRRALIGDAYAAKQIDNERRLELLADLAVDAEEWGVPLDLSSFAALPSPEIVDAVFEPVADDAAPTDEELRQLIPV